MFDLSLSKLALIGVVALLVVGPEKLPKVARMAGTLLGRAQRYFNDVKSEVSREMGIDDLNQLKNEMYKMREDIEHGLSSSLSESPSNETQAIEAHLIKARQFRRNKIRLARKHRSRGFLRPRT